MFHVKHNYCCVFANHKKLHKIMLNKNMIEKMKNFENDINNFDVFQFYTFNDFVKSQCVDFDENYKNCDLIKLKNDYDCNDENTIVLLYNVDDDEYLIINFEHDNLFIVQNFEILNVNDDVCNNALYEILKNMLFD